MIECVFLFLSLQRWILEGRHDCFQLLAIAGCIEWLRWIVLILFREGDHGVPLILLGDPLFLVVAASSCSFDTACTAE